MGRQIGHYGRLPVAAVALAILLSLTHGQTALAQGNSRSPGYWQYATSGRLDNVVTADVDGDGIDEFLVLDENGQLSLLSADGLQQWTYQSADPVSAIGTLDSFDGRNRVSDIVLAGSNHLTLLDIAGEELWQTTIPVAAAPVAVESYDFGADGCLLYTSPSPRD